MANKCDGIRLRRVVDNVGVTLQAFGEGSIAARLFKRHPLF
jgi:hypothetical protein